MKWKRTWFIALLLAGAVGTGHSQSITPSVINAGGGSGIVGSYIFEYNIGEMVAISTASTANLIVTQGLLQPVENTTILPITLIRFTGAKKTGYNQLDWATGTESGQTIFELQRSYDATSFSTIHTQPARSLANGSTYTHNDADPFRKNVYYRLKIAEDGGAIRYSNIVLLSSTQNSYWTVFPNPAKAGSDLRINLQNSDNVKTATLVITDAVGRIVYSKKLPLGSGSQTLIVAAPLSAGTYFFNLTGIPNAQNQKIIIR